MILIIDRALKHDLTRAEIRHAWLNSACWAELKRKDGENDIVAIGFDMRGRAIEMTGRVVGFDVCIYHANTPPTPRTYRELGMEKGHGHR